MDKTTRNAIFKIPRFIEKLLPIIKKIIKHLDERFVEFLSSVNRFWTIPVLGLYIYAVCILFQVGFYEYFNIPFGFINPSIVFNVVFLDSVAKGFFLGLTSNYLLLSLASVAIVISIFSNSQRRYYKFIILFFLLYILYHAQDIGKQFAKLPLAFNTIPNTCLIYQSEENIRYIIPGMYQDKLLLIGIDKDNKLQHGLKVVSVTDLKCSIELTPEISIKR